MASEARDKLAAEADKSRKALEDRLNARLAEAEKTIAATKTAAMANVRAIAVDATAAIVQRLIGVAAPDQVGRRGGRRRAQALSRRSCCSKPNSGSPSPS